MINIIPLVAQSSALSMFDPKRIRSEEHSALFNFVLSENFGAVFTLTETVYEYGHVADVHNSDRTVYFEGVRIGLLISVSSVSKDSDSFYPYCS